MFDVNKAIYACDDVICRNIESFTTEQRGLLSQNILSQLRNFVENIFVKVYISLGGEPQRKDYDTIRVACSYVKALQGEYRFLSQFHKLLQISVSHYTLDPDSSERLMLKYYEYLLRIRILMKEKFGMKLLANLSQFPLNTDKTFTLYYKAIAQAIEHRAALSTNVHHGRFYIEKIRTIIVENKIYYEVTFIPAHDKSSKFDRIIAFTHLELSDYYAVELHWIETSIKVLTRNMPIIIIVDWQVSIRYCEIKNFSKIFGYDINCQEIKEYVNLMNYLTVTRMNIVELLDLSDTYYEHFEGILQREARRLWISELLRRCRNIIQNQSQGVNVIRYLLYRLNNKIIKNQLYKIPCSLLSNLYLKVQCVPFNNIPFNFSLVNHNPPIADLLDCIDSSERTHELFARLIKNNTEQRGILYTSKADIVGFKNPEELAEKYNNVLYHRHQYARIEIFKNHFYIKEYDENVYEIIYKLKKYAESGIKNYTHSVDLWMKNSGLIIDCDEKKNALRNLFKNSKVAFIYGAAGTGKSTMINYISSLFKDKQKIFLANTNPAVENLRRKVTAEHAEFVTITKFLSKDVSNDCDILCLDECSTISNRDMVRVLQRAQCKLLVLVGDIYQIESILFGNWFNIAYKVMPKDSVAELTRPHRTTVQGLIEVWNKVREITEDRLEFITRNGLSSTLDESIFSRTEEDEIVLCLNYDGIYGINNINKFLQSNNVNPSINWGVLSYKVGDPVLFPQSGFLHSQSRLHLYRAQAPYGGRHLRHHVAHIGTISFGNGRQHDRLHRRRADALPRCQLPESARQSGGLRSTQQHHVDCDMGFERASRLREAHRLDGSHAGTGRSRLYRRYPRAYALGCQRGLLPPAHRAFRRGGEEIPPTGDRRVGYCPDRKDGQGNRVGRTRTDGGMDAGTGTGDGHHGLRCRCVAARRNGRCVPHQRKRLRCPYP